MTKILRIKNSGYVLGSVAIALFLSGCDFGRSGEAKATSSGIAQRDGGFNDRGYGGGNYGGSSYESSEFGGKSSKKQAQQKSRPLIDLESPSESHSYPSHPSYPSFPSQPSSPSYPSGPTGYGGGEHELPRFTNGRTQARAGEVSEARASHRPVGESCRSHSKTLCLGLKYVSYIDDEGGAVESEEEAIRDVEFANRIWSECGIQFQIDEYQKIQPWEHELRYHSRNYEELNEIRRTFTDRDKFLVVATGQWDRSGSLGNTWANAWTNLPGERQYGIVLERAVSGYPQILAHELGHYLSLDHVNDPHSLMNPVVHKNSLNLDRDECRAARWAVRTYWRDMLR